MQTGELIWAFPGTDDGHWWPAVVADPTTVGYEAQEGSLFVVYRDGSGGYVLASNAAPFDPSDASKNTGAPEVKEDMEWAISYYQSMRGGATGAPQAPDEAPAPSKKKEKRKKDRGSDAEDGDSASDVGEAAEERAKRKAEKRKRKEEKRAAKQARKEAAAAAVAAASDDEDEGDEEGDAAAKHSSRPGKRNVEGHSSGAAHGRSATVDETDTDLFSFQDGGHHVLTVGSGGTADGSGRGGGGGRGGLGLEDTSAANLAVRGMPTGVQHTMNRIRLEYSLQRRIAAENDLLMARPELEVLAYFARKLQEVARNVKLLTALLDSGEVRDEAERREVREAVAKLQSYDAVEEFRAMKHTVTKDSVNGPHRDQRVVHNANFVDPLVPAPLQDVDEAPVADAAALDAAAGALFGDMSRNGSSSSFDPPRFVGMHLRDATAGSGRMVTAMSHSGRQAHSLGTDPVHAAGLRRVPVMSKWLAGRDLHHAGSSKDSQPVLPTGAVARRFNSTNRRFHTKAERRAIQLGHSFGVLGGVSQLGGQSVAEIDLVDFTIEGIDSFHHEDSGIMSTQLSAASPLVSIASGGSQSDGESAEWGTRSGGAAGAASRGRSVESDMRSEDGAQLPSVSQMWAPASDPHAAALADTAAAPTSAAAAAAEGASAGTVHRRRSSAGAAAGTYAWKARAKVVVRKALTPYLRGDNGKPVVLDNDSFSRVASEIVKRVLARATAQQVTTGGEGTAAAAATAATAASGSNGCVALPRSLRRAPGSAAPGGGGGAAADLGEMSDATAASIAASAVRYVERHYVSGTRGLAADINGHLVRHLSAEGRRAGSTRTGASSAAYSQTPYNEI